MDAKASLSVGYENNHFRWIRRPQKPIYTMVRAELMVNKKNIKFGTTHIFTPPPPVTLAQFSRSLNSSGSQVSSDESVVSI